MTETELKMIDRRMQEAPETSLQLQDSSPAGMMIAAMSKGMDLDKLERFMSLQNQWEEQEAKKAYTAAMAAFKRNPPKIEKDRHVRFETQKGTTEYKHASLANVTEKINGALGEHGLSAAWVMVQENDKITVTCTITHKMGHSEETSLTASPDISGTKNAIQAIGSTISYLQRYTILALTGLATGDMDTDGKTVEYISDKQVSILTDLINDTGADEAKFLAYMDIESMAKITTEQYSKAVAALRKKGAQK